jgi:hypothetical protein
MNRKELAYAAAGLLVGAAGCSGAAKSLLVPEAQAAPSGASESSPRAATVDQVHLLLSLGHPLARTQFFALNGKADYWTAASSDPGIVTIDTTRLRVTGISSSRCKKPAQRRSTSAAPAASNCRSTSPSSPASPGGSGNRGTSRPAGRRLAALLSFARLRDHRSEEDSALAAARCVRG